MKDKKDLVGLSRAPLVNQLHAAGERPPAYNMHGFVGENWFTWLFKNLATLGNSHYPYQTYVNPAANNGIFRMAAQQNETVAVALLADWASDTAESHHIAQLCGVRDYSIHLGDTYYVGNEKEISDNFNSTIDAPWPYGSSGSFAMLGNHEMYSSGKKYFTHLLPYMGMLKGEHTNTQEAAFFCLENDYWRIIGLDTGYYSLKGLLGVKPNFNLALHDAQMDWLKNIVQPGKDNRGIIFLSHHQYVSAFEEEYRVPGQQLATLLNPGQTVLWFCGHEHRMAVYGRNQLDNGAAFYGRCIGHGGMPVELNSGTTEKKPKGQDAADPANRNLVLYDNRQRELLDGKIPLGHNGYVLLRLQGNNLVAEYYDDNDMQPETRKVLEETWTVNLGNGALSGTGITDYTAGSVTPLKLFAGDISLAIH